MMMSNAVELSNGVRMPRLGFGTWQIEDGDAAYDAVSTALKTGYRLIDTARAYGNEASVGRAVRDSGLPRDEVFVVSKLPAEVKNRDAALRSFDETASSLALDHVDLYLIHAPWPWEDIGGDYAEGNREAWAALETIHATGRARAIGVSNFGIADLTAIAAPGSLAPMANQIRYFVGKTPDDVITRCREDEIAVMGYSPLATGAILDAPVMRDLSERYGRTVAQICIRYALQNGIVPIPKSTKASRIVENAAVDFEITVEDMRMLDSLKDVVKQAHGPDF